MVAWVAFSLDEEEQLQLALEIGERWTVELTDQRGATRARFRGLVLASKMDNADRPGHVVHIFEEELD